MISKKATVIEALIMLPIVYPYVCCGMILGGSRYLRLMINTFFALPRFLIFSTFSHPSGAAYHRFGKRLSHNCFS